MSDHNEVQAVKRLERIVLFALAREIREGTIGPDRHAVADLMIVAACNAVSCEKHGRDPQLQLDEQIRARAEVDADEVEAGAEVLASLGAKR